MVKIEDIENIARCLNDLKNKIKEDRDWRMRQIKEIKAVLKGEEKD